MLVSAGFWAACSKGKSAATIISLILVGSPASGMGLTYSPILFKATLSPNRDRRNGRAGRSLQLERRDHESELVDLLRRQFIELEMFQKMDAVDNERHLVDRARQHRIGRRRDFHRGIIGAQQHRVLGD